LFGSTSFAPKSISEKIDNVSVNGINFSFIDRAFMFPVLPFYYFAPHFFTPYIANFFLNRLRISINCKPNIIHHGRIGRENLGFASLKLARELKVPFVLTPFHHPRWVGWRYRKYIELYKKQITFLF
jgi:hypothetical protein